MYTEIKEPYSTQKGTYIIAFCPDTDSFFVTNERHFYYEHEKDFESERQAIEYFKTNGNEFISIRNKLMQEMGQRNQNHVYLENIQMFFVQADDNNVLQMTPSEFYEYRKNHNTDNEKGLTSELELDL